MTEQDGTTPPAEPTAAEIATYVAEACRELRVAPRAPRFRTVNYLLDHVRIEAEKIARNEGSDDPDGR